MNIKETLYGTKKLPKELENSYQIPGSNIYYIGKLINIKLESWYRRDSLLELNASLTKWEKYTRIDTKRKYLLFGKKEETKVPDEKIIWRIYADDVSDLFEDQPCSGTPYSEDYFRKILNRRASYQNIILENDLLDKIFGPLEESLREFLK